MSLSVRIGLASLVALLILAFVGYGALLRLNVLPRLALAPGWVLTDQFGERFTSEDLRGTIALYTFDYSANEDPNRQTHELMRDVQKLLAAHNVPRNFLSRRVADAVRVTAATRRVLACAEFVATSRHALPSP